MQPNIHPQYGPAEAQCACGNTFQTRSTKKTLKVEICNNCHPFFTGLHKFIDKAGRIERFMRKYNKSTAAKTANEAATAAEATATSKPKDNE